MGTRATMSEAVRALRVLVIDDNAYDRLLLRRALYKGGWAAAIDEAETVADGLRRAAENAYDLLFVDDHLPGEQGAVAFVTCLREKGLRAPVIVLRGHDDSPAATALVEAGALEFLPKSLLTPEGVGQSLRTVMRLHEIAAAAARSSSAQRLTEQRLRQVVDKAPIIVFSTDLDGVLTSVEGRGLALLGVTPAEVVGRSFFAFHDPDSDTADDLRAALRGETVTSVIGLRGRHFDVWYSPLSDDAAAGVVGVAVDITDLKRAEDALAASEERWRSAVSGMHDGVIVSGEQGDIVSINPAAERMFGLRAAEAAGRGVGELLSDPHAGGGAAWRKSYRLAVGRVTEWVGRRRDGGTFNAEVSLAEIVLTTGRFFAANVRDVSERKQLDRLKSDFVSVVSHELRTPVTSLVGSLKLATASKDLSRSPELARLVEIAMRNAERLVSLLGDIIDVEQIESGQLKVRRVPLDLCEVVANAVNACAGLMGEAVQVRTESEAAAAPVLGDPERLVQVVLNLLSNAVKYSPPGGEVVVRLAAQDGTARVSIHDEGPGIPAVFRERVFGKFQRADTSDSRKKGGTGLGLAIARGIVEEHDGRIGFDTGEGAGTTFWFELPLGGWDDA